MNVTFEVDTQKKLITVRVFGDICPVETRIHFARLGTFVTQYPSFNILMDLLDSVLAEEQMTMSRAMDVASFYGFMQHGAVGKVAALIPDNEQRLFHARNIESAAQIKGLRYRVFTDRQEALAWLR